MNLFIYELQLPTLPFTGMGQEDPIYVLLLAQRREGRNPTIPGIHYAHSGFALEFKCCREGESL